MKLLEVKNNTYDEKKKSLDGIKSTLNNEENNQ